MQPGNMGEKKAWTSLFSSLRLYATSTHLIQGFALCLQGTERTKEHFNIFLEYVPGGSIASLLAKFGAPMQLAQMHTGAIVIHQAAKQWPHAAHAADADA